MSSRFVAVNKFEVNKKFILCDKMSLDIERLIPVNFATVEDLVRIPHVGPKVACAIITLRESHGNLTLDTLQTFLRTKFDAETWEM